MGNFSSQLFSYPVYRPHPHFAQIFFWKTSVAYTRVNMVLGAFTHTQKMLNQDKIDKFYQHEEELTMIINWGCSKSDNRK